MQAEDIIRELHRMQSEAVMDLAVYRSLESETGEWEHTVGRIEAQGANDALTSLILFIMREQVAR